MNYNIQDVKDLAYCSWMEARGEGESGMQAVQHVVVNRVGFPGFPSTVHAVIYEKNQFSWTMPDNPEYGKEPLDGDPQYAYALSLAPAVLANTDPDITLGAHYYANLKYTTSGWFFNHIVNDSINHAHTVKIGNQDFYI